MKEGKIIIGLIAVLAIIMLTTTPLADSYIPPTRAFFKIISGGANVTAQNSTASVNFIAGSGITISPNYAANSVTFTSTGGNGTSSNIWSIDCTPDFIQIFSNSTYPNFTCGTAPTSGSTFDTMQNIGTGEGSIYAGNTTNTNFTFKTLKQGQNISLANNTNDITITSAGFQNNTASNVGGDYGWFKQKSGVDLQFKSIKAGSNISLANNTNDITITATDTGEVNTASNLGTFGQGVFSSKVGVDLQFKKLLSIDNQLTISSNSTNITFDLPDGLLTAAITSINADTTAAQVFSGTAGNVTITDTGAGTLQWNLGPDVVMEGGTQIITGTKTMNALTLGGQINFNGNTILNTGTLTLPTTTGTLVETVEAATFITNGKTFNDNILKVRNPGDTQSYSIRSSAITAARDLNLPLTRQTETLAVVPPVLDAAPGNPSGTASTTGVMAGLGSTCTITPQTTGKVFMIVSAQGTTNTGDDGFGFDLRYGTGAAPANGDALTGTIIHAVVNAQSIGSTSTTDVLTAPITLQGLPTGLTAGTAIWIDIGQRAVTGGTATFTNVRCTAFEV